jgi:hypothetical protein
MRMDVIKIVTLEVSEGNNFHHITKSELKKTTAQELFC